MLGDDVLIYLVYLLGFGFSTIVGGFGTRQVINTIEAPLSYSAELLGYVETTIYTATWLAGKESFIPVWLGLKVLRLWGSMTLQEARPIFNRWLVGLGVSLIYGVAGAEIIKRAKAGQWNFVLLLPPTLFVATLLLAWRGKVLKSRR